MLFRSSRNAYIIKAIFVYSYFFLLDIFDLVSWCMRKRSVSALLSLKAAPKNEKKLTNLKSSTDSTKKILKRYLVDKQLNVLSHRNFEFTGNKRWRKDFYSGYVWFFGWHKFLNRKRPSNSDIKVPWEINRLQWLNHLLELNQDQNTINYVVETVFDHFNSNPPGFTVGWACTMDVSIRAVNLVFVLDQLENCCDIKNDVAYRKAVFTLLNSHLKFIKRYDEWGGGKRNNHYLTNLLALFIINRFLYRKGFGDFYFDQCCLFLEKLISELPYQFP